MKLAVLLALATVFAALPSAYQQDCAPPEAPDLESVIASLFSIGDGAPTSPSVNVTAFNVVCRAHSNLQGSLKLASAVVQYSCSGHTDCTSRTVVVEQIESECGFATDGVTVVWTNNVEGSTDTSLIRSQPADATLSTTAREDCSACLSPQLANIVGATTDSVTHCVGK